MRSILDEIMVSICCITYNHENYIADAIESFLMQKKNFAFEILIHDDASTDNTASIIREYEKKYPGLIKPIYQVENQYSKGIQVQQFNYERAKGKYIALCEGDDYWLDPDKLQKQVDYLEDHPNCSMCAHAALMVTTEKQETGVELRPSVGSRLLTVEEIISNGGGFISTNSIVYKAQYADSRPDFFNKTRIGDYPLAIYLALKGEVYYIDEYMSAYRTGVPGSWTERVATKYEPRKNHYKEIETMLDAVNKYSNYKHNKVIMDTKRKNNFGLRKLYISCFKIKTNQSFPLIYKFLKQLKYLLRK